VDELIRVRLVVYGQVQGVFFRRSAKIEADNLGLYGWVKNLDDNSVSIMVEGNRIRVDEFVIWCRKGPPELFINVAGFIKIYLSPFI